MKKHKPEEVKAKKEEKKKWKELRVVGEENEEEIRSRRSSSVSFALSYQK